MSDHCCSVGAITLLYTCSGSSDVGELTDRTARVLWKEGFGLKTCLAGVGADLSGFVQAAKGADVNITLDGCPFACARKGLERIGLRPVSIVLSNLGYNKGESPVTEERIESVVVAVKEALWTPQKEKADATVAGGSHA